MKIMSLLGVAAVMSTLAGGAAEKDPYGWLEEVTSTRALAWAKAQSEATVERLASDAEFKVLESRIRDILNARDRVPYVEKYGDYYYNYWRDEANPRGLWRRTTLDQYKLAEPSWEIVLDLDALAKQEHENWVYSGSSILVPTYDRALVSLSRGGADAVVVREFDLEEKAFVADGFTLPEAKSRVAWAGPDRIFVGSNFGSGSMTASGYPRKIKSWHRGQTIQEATVEFEGADSDVSVVAFADLSPGYENEFLVRATTFYTSQQFVKRSGRWLQLDVPLDAPASVHRGLLTIMLKSDWNVGGRVFLAGSLLASDFETFLRGERKFDILFEPSASRALASYTATRNHLLITERENVTNRVYVATKTSSGWKRELLLGADRLASIEVAALDSNNSDDYIAITTDFVTPTTISLHTVGSSRSHFSKSWPAYFDAGGIAVSQHWVKSKDGTNVPYFQVGRPSADPQPTLLTGYGGFEISSTPSYDPVVGASWLEMGHIFVLANIRGGGEFGPKWHQAALRENRRRAYEDFIAVAEDLVRRKVTTSRQLGVRGGSNGGLLVGNMLTMRPDLFGAVVCAVPLLDMRRYHKLLAGASWMAEYGNPDDPEQWEFMRVFSPYHNVEPGKVYPTVLMTTSTRDDRVHPAHARKMTAKMHDMGHEVFYYENIEGGHGGSADNTQQAFMSAIAYRFLEQLLVNRSRR